MFDRDLSLSFDNPTAAKAFPNHVAEISQTYLEKLEAAVAGDKKAADDYDWIVLEMLDQMVRESSGGLMLEYLRRQPLPNEQFILQRIGDEGRKLHHWMYDRFSLARELMAAGFREPVVRSASESAIAAWSRFYLDVQF